MTTVTRQRPETPARYLSLPAPVEVWERDGDGCAWLKASEEWVRIVSLENLWEMDGYRLAGPPVLRMHFLATTEYGEKVSLYQDLVEGRWFRQLSLGD